MANDKLKNLITAIEESDLNKVQDALNSGIINGDVKSSIVNLKTEDKKTPLHVALEQANQDFKIIELLLVNGADPNIEDGNGESAVCLAIKNRESREIQNKLLEKLDLRYRYSGPLNDKTKRVNINGDNCLHIAARARNIDAFLFIFKKSVEDDIPLLEYNEDHENPLHIAARMGILKVVVREMLSYLKSTAKDEINKLEDHIEKARKDGSNEDVKANQKRIKEIKEKLESNRSYIKNALNSKYALSKDRRTPLDLVSKEVRNEIKETAGIGDRWIDNKNLRVLLCVALAAVFIAALCMSLTLLFYCAESLALATVASICVTGIVSTGTVLVSEICKDDGPYTGMNSSEATPYSDSLALSA